MLVSAGLAGDLLWGSWTESLVTALVVDLGAQVTSRDGPEALIRPRIYFPRKAAGGGGGTEIPPPRFGSPHRDRDAS